MEKNEKSTPSTEIDPDDFIPELDDAWFEEADAYIGTKLVRRGRPKSENPKQAVSLRLDPEVIAWFKRSGEGWQTRINEALRKVAGIA
jgi:uncharacterized protein (DUF4415 family)